MIIDAHQHFWKLDLPFDYAWLNEPQHQPICRDFLPQDLLPRLRSTGIDKTLFVQTQHDLQENRWALMLAREHEFIAGIVGWVDLTSDRCEGQLMEFRDDPLFVGVRHITQAEPDADFIVRSDVIRGLKVLQKHQVPFDLLFYSQHLKHAAALARQLPELRLVIDHLSKPKIKDCRIDEWRTDLQRAARFPNVFCKLSGLVTEADWKLWSVQDLKPYVETALEAFGADRCMFGSDWPVCELAADYQQVFSTLNTLVADLSAAEKAQIFCGTASRFYGLNLPGGDIRPLESGLTPDVGR